MEFFGKEKFRLEQVEKQILGLIESINSSKGMSCLLVGTVVKLTVYVGSDSDGWPIHRSYECQIANSTQLSAVNSMICGQREDSRNKLRHLATEYGLLDDSRIKEVLEG